MLALSTSASAVQLRIKCIAQTIAEKVQDSVACAVEAMTGMSPVVNIRVAGISFDK